MLYFRVHTFSSLLLLLTFSASSFQSMVAGTNTSSIQSEQPDDMKPPYEVQFNYRITANRKGHLTCEVLFNPEVEENMTNFANRSRSHVYLRCPQVATEICYVDCTPACIYDEVDGCVVPYSLSTVIEDCRSEYIDEGHKILLDYTIVIEALDRTGDWNCEYQGVSASRSLKLQAAPKLPTTTTSPATTIAAPTTVAGTTTATSVSVSAMSAAIFPSRDQVRSKPRMMNASLTLLFFKYILALSGFMRTFI